MWYMYPGHVVSWSCDTRWAGLKSKPSTEMKGLVGVCLLLVASFTACRGDGTLDFLILGDWGGQDTSPYYTKAEEEIAEQMGKTATQIASQFTLALGDNFYSFGVKDVDDPRFEETFEVRQMAI